MECPACGGTNPDDSRYCNQCGAGVATRPPRPTAMGVPRVMVPPGAAPGVAIGPPPVDEIESLEPDDDDDSQDVPTIPVVDVVSLPMSGPSTRVLVAAGVCAVLLGTAIGAGLALRGGHTPAGPPVGLLGTPTAVPQADTVAALSDAAVLVVRPMLSHVGVPIQLPPSTAADTLPDASVAAVEVPPTRQAPRAGDEVEVVGHMDPRVFGSVYQRNIPQVTACYASASRGQAVAGVILMRVRIGLDGHVTRTQVISDTTPAPQLATCVQNSVRTWRFPAPQGGAVDVDYPLRFGRAG